ncbi:MAG: hypothetical protein ACKVTZ_04515 [Bacteroidia bacterium]
MKKYLILLFVCSLHWGLFAQKNLSVGNYNKAKRVVFEPGEIIRLKTQDKGLVFNGKIETVNDTFIVLLKGIKISDGDGVQRTVYRDKVLLKDIRYIYKKPHRAAFLPSSARIMLGLGGLMFTGFGLMEVAQKRHLSMNLPLGAASFLIGGIWFVTEKKGYKIGKKWELKAIEPVIRNE